MQIFLCGLYRSGTTITWKTISQDSHWVSFDEPFNENLKDLPKLNRSKSNEKYLPRYQEEPSLFKNLFAPILPEEDLKKDFSAKQKQYLQQLLKPYRAVNIDFTRCTFKLAELRRLYPDALIIHLKRQPAAFVSSHIMTSYRECGLKARLGRWYREKTFFSRKSRYNFYNYEKIIEKHEPKQFEYLLPKLKKYQGKKLQDLPAYVKMLLLHRHNQNIVDEFANTHPENFLEWQFENFLKEPQLHLEQIYSHFNQSMPKFNFDSLSPPNLGYLPNSENWDIFL